MLFSCQYVYSLRSASPVQNGWTLEATQTSFDANSVWWTNEDDDDGDDDNRDYYDGSRRFSFYIHIYYIYIRKGLADPTKMRTAPGPAVAAEAGRA